MNEHVEVLRDIRSEYAAYDNSHHQLAALDAAIAALTRSDVPAGMVLVPREPTEAMMSAWFNGICNDGRTLAIDDDIRAAARQDWSVMIEAAP